ncbi:DUF1214 domain-containing protein [Rubritalea marina]|uniref:DUF1214 domain-containing protein n=1 Tax=Rubritalea marina TaxID=361055 RepID=UPI00036288EC|nr:DUF1214 domain-containing protein [Rubritalea marina]
MHHKTVRPFLLAALSSISTLSAEETPIKAYETRIGTLNFENNFENGIPTQESSQQLFSEIDFQRACQAYIWSVPFMGFYEWMFVHDELGVERGQIVYHESYQSKLGGLTFNTSTPYVVTFADLTEDPLLIEMPDAPVRGATHTMWQVGLAQMTKPGKYLFVGPECAPPKDIPADIQVFKSDTNHVFFGVRLTNDTHEKRMEDMKKIKLTNFTTGKPSSEREPLFQEKGLDLMQKRGMAFWKSLHKAINLTPVREQDRIIVDFLRPLGVEIGKDFVPNPAQAKILKEAVFVGEAMTKNIDFNKTGRLPHAEFGPESSTWEVATASSPNQDRDHGMDLDGRAAWFYEAVTNDIAMHGLSNHAANPSGKDEGWGQVYLDNYRDDEHKGLNGSFHYTIEIPGDIKIADFFWTITVYNVNNRAIVDNQQNRADVGSNIEGTKKNERGNFEFHFSPEKPDGLADANWVQTKPNENWFVYFRAYSPTKEFVDGKIQLPNFKRVR